MDITISAEDVKPTRRMVSGYNNKYDRGCACGNISSRDHYGIDDCLFYLHSRIAKLESILNVERED